MYRLTLTLILGEKSEEKGMPYSHASMGISTRSNYIKFCCNLHMWLLVVIASTSCGCVCQSQAFTTPKQLISKFQQLFASNLKFYEGGRSNGLRGDLHYNTVDRNWTEVLPKILKIRYTSCWWHMWTIEKYEMGPNCSLVREHKTLVLSTPQLFKIKTIVGVWCIIP